MPERCQFIYTDRNAGVHGKVEVCGRPEADHCAEQYADHYCAPEKVPHTFTRAFLCPTCGCKRKGDGCRKA